jgi:hypothetical protein
MTGTISEVEPNLRLTINHSSTGSVMAARVNRQLRRPGSARAVVKSRRGIEPAGHAGSKIFAHRRRVIMLRQRET